MIMNTQYGFGTSEVKRTVIITAKTEFKGDNNFRLTNLAATVLFAPRYFGGQIDVQVR